MRVDSDPAEGGILIRGSNEELVEFAEAIMDAAESGESRIIGNLLTETGVENVRVQIDED